MERFRGIALQSEAALVKRQANRTYRHYHFKIRNGLQWEVEGPEGEDIQW